MTAPDPKLQKLLNQQKGEHDLRRQMEGASEELLFDELLKTKTEDYIAGWLDHAKLVSEEASAFLNMVEKHEIEQKEQFPQYFGEVVESDTREH